MALFSEPASITMERETLTKTLEVLSKARKAINKDPDLASISRTEEEDKPADAKK